MARTLASIQKIESLSPIPNADKIEVAKILGWECVVKRGEYREGQNVIYVEVDSILPPKPEFEFMKDRKYRVKTIKLRGQISQGLVLPLSTLPEDWKFRGTFIGQDVTKALGITKYDPQEEAERELETKQVGRLTKFMRRFAWYRKLFGVSKSGTFPSWISKTDEVRIQKFPDICETHSSMYWEVTEKLDGQSATYFLKRSKLGRFEFGVCSRQNLLPHPDNSSWWTIAKDKNMESVLRSLIGKNEWIVIQGEIIGTGIQGNKYKLSGYEFYAFNVVTPQEKWNTFKMVARLPDFGINVVPLVDMFWRLPATIQGAVKFSINSSRVNSNIQREGIVCRNYDTGMSFKIINPEFLLKNDE